MKTRSNRPRGIGEDAALPGKSAAGKWAAAATLCLCLAITAGAADAAAPAGFTEAQLRSMARNIVATHCSTPAQIASYKSQLLANDPALGTGGGTALDKAIDAELDELTSILAQNPRLDAKAVWAGLLALDDPYAIPGSSSPGAAVAAADQAPAKKSSSRYLIGAEKSLSAATRALQEGPQGKDQALKSVITAGHDLAQVPSPSQEVTSAAGKIPALSSDLAKVSATAAADNSDFLKAQGELDEVTRAVTGAVTPPAPVDHFFTWIGYEVANPFVFTPAGPMTTTTSTSTTTGGTTTTTTTTTTSKAAAPAYGTVKPSTTSGLTLEADYLNRLAWDPRRGAALIGAQALNPLNLRNWDVEARLFFSLASPPSSSSSSGSGSSGGSSSGGGSSGAGTVSATSLEGSGNFGAEVAVAQNFYVANSDPTNFQTIGLEERVGGISDRSNFRNHSEEFIGMDYTVGSMLSSSAAEPLRLNVRAGASWLDTVAFVNPADTTSTTVYTVNGAPEFFHKGFGTFQCEALIPLSSSAFITVGGRVYVGTTRPAPWTSYIGYTLDIGSLAQALSLPGSKASSSTQVSKDPSASQAP